MDDLVKKDEVAATLMKVGDALRDGDVNQLAAGYIDLVTWYDRLDKVVEMSKAALKKAALAQGEQTSASGTRQLRVGDAVIIVKAQNSELSLDEDKVQGKLMGKGIPNDKGMNATIVWKPDLQKLKILVAEGLLTEQDLIDCRAERKWALQKPKRYVEESDNE